ncbi:hypothetical protein TIFTF001_051094 [Ficus carica]|uniref:Uncharacterized protein n=1 Tax=Ficus carica TaxID=3494 RepID=A0AA87YZZ5_FICCA|nr:hypothetical protein TIFTF001_051094 [Ficus carica]
MPNIASDGWPSRWPLVGAVVVGCEMRLEGSTNSAVFYSLVKPLAPEEEYSSPVEIVEVRAMMMNRLFAGKKNHGQDGFFEVIKIV